MPGTHVWRTPHTRWLLVDQHGTHRVDESLGHALTGRSHGEQHLALMIRDQDPSYGDLVSTTQVSRAQECVAGEAHTHPDFGYGRCCSSWTVPARRQNSLPYGSARTSQPPPGPRPPTPPQCTH